MSFIRVLAVDDSERWQLYILKSFKTESDLKIVAQVGDGLEAVQKAAELCPDIIVMELSLSSINGLETTRRIRSVSANSKVLFFSEHRSKDLVAAAFEAGAHGYVLKSDAASDLVPSIRAILKNEEYLSRSLRGDGGPFHSDVP